ncbi:TetR/AcrR family transcriptional regulator C-terminal domain-containing protein [Microbacterium sp. SZ1]|uniref:TetR/AcrR family transcriptional regulator C-terminal domain-containing protein n=1 Tax=Microbacterium sp. SZ1 TaxID=1849736 RepID=UPI00211C6F6C|nr:TetR/AcrR family transcriptional regulator C-terminal domain-containing protein [Microbacterium sp. SZ1]
MALADASGLEAVTMRAIARSIDMPTMSTYTYANNRDDLLVLMADEANAELVAAPELAGEWRSRVRTLAEDNLRMLRRHSWMLDIDDPRTVLGPGTIAKYDRELHAFDGMDLDPVRRDAALTFVLGFVRSVASRAAEHRRSAEFGEGWTHIADRLASRLGRAYPLAQEVGGAAGAAANSSYDGDAAWRFGLDRVIDGLAAVSRPA